LAITLRRRGFLSCPPGKKDYRLGSSMWTLMREYDWSNLLVEISHDALNLLATEINETAHIAIREGSSVLIIDSAHSSRIITTVGRTSELDPLHCTAYGKAILADSNENELRALLGSGPLRSYTKNTITTIRTLADNCAVIHERGYAIDDLEHYEDLRCIAAPIRLNNQIVGSIGISAPASRLPDTLYSKYGEKVCAIANKIGASLHNVERDSV
jgi:DNA-binding IclR family transcriptional regulator